ncbi:MAG TPA: ATP-binding protein [Kiritimatiellia bacterium]|nr:ATP-binding protein [Kiritimatiellia bacterium]HMO99644.1 ATP-binding protein [Kiritimatiellia bacterium]HMP97109.1 ATP-binding protein [Kiritimatiellia bacterium]
MNEQQKNVNALIERIEKHQVALKLNDTQFVARYQRYLGSTKTWRDRLIARNWSEIEKTLDKWEQKLRVFCSELDGMVQVVDFMESLPIAQYGMQLYSVLQGQKNDRRVGWLIGPTGVGKSWTMARIKDKNARDAAYLHINRGAKDSMMVLSKQLARAVGASIGTSGADTFDNVVDVLIGKSLTLVIDDVQEGGVLMLKLVKHLVDDTRVKLILGTYPTAWNALVNGSTDAMSEAQQLLGRSLKPVNKTWHKGVTASDVAVYLKGAVGGGDCKVVAERITPILVRNGNFRVLADAVELARINADEAGEDLSADMVADAIEVICPKENK